MLAAAERGEPRRLRQVVETVELRPPDARGLGPVDGVRQPRPGPARRQLGEIAERQLVELEERRLEPFVIGVGHDGVGLPRGREAVLAAPLEELPCQLAHVRRRFEGGAPVTQPRGSAERRLVGERAVAAVVRDPGAQPPVIAFQHHRPQAVPIEIQARPPRPVPENPTQSGPMLPKFLRSPSSPGSEVVP